MGLFYLLLNDSARMKRVVTEVRDQQKARGVLDFESLAGLSYLNACAYTASLICLLMSKEMAD